VVALVLAGAAGHAAPGQTSSIAGAPYERAASFSLGLDAALDRAPSFHDDELAPLSSEARRPAVAGVSLPDIRDLSAIRDQQVTTPSFEPKHRWGGFGRWLKRHWWAPVLVGAAVVYVATDDSGDDDDALGEDD
jgi:hypothetical protein